jgi:hypothetical protein
VRNRIVVALKIRKPSDSRGKRKLESGDGRIGGKQTHSSKTKLKNNNRRLLHPQRLFSSWWKKAERKNKKEREKK